MKNKIINIFIFLIITISLLSSNSLGVGIYGEISTHSANSISAYSSYDLIIITTEFLSTELLNFKEHKEKHDIITKIITIEEIKTEFYFPKIGKDNAEQIKYFIKNAYDSWNISYVLFIGGPAIIPIRRCNIIPFEDVPVDYTSELYYADIYDKDGIFSSWNNDDDELFGEWYNASSAEDNKQDLIPEIGLGRISCYNPEEVRNYVNKIIDYESNLSDPSWFNNMVVASGETFLEFEGLEGEIMTQNALDVMKDFNPVKLWYSNGRLDRLGISIIKAITKGCGFLYLAGHGNSYIWATFNPEGKTESIFSILHVPFLSNRGKYPVAILSGCHVCKIEKSFCLGWQLTKNKYKGSIATLGPTNIGYLGFEYDGGGLDWLELQFFKEYMNGSRILGDIWKQVLTEFADNYPIDWNLPAGLNCAIDAKMASEWIVIGDPTLKIGGYQ
jgi:hypothetical protein